MLPKPDGCKICPLYGDGYGFVPDEIIQGAKVTVLLQNPGHNEEREGKPAIGATGDILNQTLLPQAGLARGRDVSVANALRCRYNHSNNLPPKPILDAAIKHCRQYDSAPAQLTIAAGAAAWKACGQQGGVTDWRGFLSPDGKYLATLHPADLFRNPKMKLTVMSDWHKVGRYLAGTWPSPLPALIKIPAEAPVAALDALKTSLECHPAPYVVVDTEYIPATGWMTVIGLGGPGTPVYQVWMEQLTPVDRKELRHILTKLFGSLQVVFQNSFADVPILEQNLGIKYSDYKQIADTMLQHAVLWSDWPHTLEFLASMYGRYLKMKHLSISNPSLYNMGDVLDTVCAHEGLQGELRRDPLSKSVYEGQSLPLISIILKRMKKGIRVNKARVQPAIAEYEGLIYAATNVARSACGWPINIGSADQLKLYLYEMIGLPVQIDKDTKKPTTDGDAIATLRVHVGPVPDLEAEDKNGLGLDSACSRIDAGADPVLEARVIYAAAKQTLSHYLTPLVDNSGVIVDRIYPQFKIHAQASGRWSTTDPPLAQLPEELRDIIIPDPGTAWISWDWDQIELRLLAALAQDMPYLDAFKAGSDVHALNAQAIFDLPQLPVGQDPQRVFAKRFVYRLNYGGHPRTAGDIPGAKQLGLDGPKLVQASNRYLAAHPAMAEWRRRLAGEVTKSHVVRTFTGRRRRLLGDSQAALREAYNHPMQGGVADILNLTLIAIDKALPYSSVVFTMHDSATIEVPVEKAHEAETIIKSVVAKVWDIEGLKISFPAKFKPVLYGT